tara:strand:- start:652 stop:852 length:201 start_codon:yes stop_codon:yes gene_type:complete
MKLDYSKITDLEIAGINYKDAWRFSDAHIVRAKYEHEDGKYRNLTDDELDSLDSEWVHEQVLGWIH